MNVAALFCATRSIYHQIDGVDVWTKRDDARTYAGPHVVVAHPPCNRADGGTFAAALLAIHLHGGVTEPWAPPPLLWGNRCSRPASERLTPKEASATPLAFAVALVELARSIYASNPAHVPLHPGMMPATRRLQLDLVARGAIDLELLARGSDALAASWR